MTDNHYCRANARPNVDSHRDGEPILSATLSSGSVEVYMTCEVCGEELAINYQME